MPVTKVYSNKNSLRSNDSITNYTINPPIESIKYDGKNPSNTVASYDLMITDTRGIFAIPYQFMSSVDRRVIYDNKTTKIGAKYADKVVSKMPLLFITPCKQKFMAGYDKNDRAAVISDLINGQGLSSDFINSQLTKNGRYYTTSFEWDTYYKYVNTLCGIMASYIGIDNVSIDTNSGKKKIKNINWATDFLNKDFKNYFNAQNSVIYYLDGQSVTEMSESFSNSTKESSLASQLNGYGDQIDEIQFLLGDDNQLVNAIGDAASELAEGLAGNLSSVFSNLTGSMLSDLASKGTSTILSGGTLVFPKLWDDFSFSRSYSFTIKLRSPDHDNLSIFLNIMVPYIHMLALVLPVAHEDNANAYNAPFLVKAYCKGLFNINDGIISDLSVTRGAECQWNDDGLPTQMDLSISIEDLYSSLFMSAIGGHKNENPIISVLGELNIIQKLKDSFSVVQNTAMMDYLANLAGFNLADEELGRSVRMLLKMTTSTFTQVGNDVYNRFDRQVANVIKNLYF